MAHIIFYEKPGCINNTRQKKVLRELGHSLEERDLLQESWSPQRLMRFFMDRPMDEWVNISAPRIKNGLVMPDKLTAEQLLDMMVKDPLLIRRPLIEADEACCCGFDDQPLIRALGVIKGEAASMQDCPRQQS